jgi:hypothetical protein
MKFEDVDGLVHSLDNAWTSDPEATAAVLQVYLLCGQNITGQAADAAQISCLSCLSRGGVAEVLPKLLP